MREKEGDEEEKDGKRNGRKCMREPPLKMKRKQN